MQIALEDIRVLPFAPAENGGAPSEIGVVTRRTGERLHVVLCNIAENNGAPPGPNILRVCMEVRDRIAPGMPLSAIDWHMVSGFDGSTLHFRQAYTGAPLIASCSNDYAFHEGLNGSYSLTRYPEMIEGYLNAGREKLRRSPASATFVPINAAPGYVPVNTDMTLALCAGGSARLLMVDTDSFAKIWMKKLKIFDKNLYACASQEAAIEHLARPYGHRNPFAYGLKPAQIAYHPHGRNGVFGFVNGNHRTLNFIALGAPFMPMIVDAYTFDDMKEFKDKYEYKAPLRAMPSPSILRADYA